MILQNLAQIVAILQVNYFKTLNANLEVYKHSFSYYYQGLIVPLSILVPVCVAIFKYSYLTRALKIIFFYLIVSGLINLAAILQSGANNMPLLHIYTVVEFVFLIFFFKSINTTKKSANYLHILLFAFPILCIINVAFFQSKYQFNSYVRPLEALIFIYYSFTYFYQSLDVEIEQPWNSFSLNWINAGLLIYFSSSFFLFVFSNVISKSLKHASKMLIWNLHDTVVIVLYVLIAIGFSKCKKSLPI